MGCPAEGTGHLNQHTGWELKGRQKREKSEGLLSGPASYAHHSPSVDTFLLALTLGSRVGHMIQVWPTHVFFSHLVQDMVKTQSKEHQDFLRDSCSGADLFLLVSLS